MLIPNIHLNGEGTDAIALYEKAFGAEVRYRTTYGESAGGAYAPAYDAYIWHAEIYIGPLRLTLSDSPEPAQRTAATVSIMLSMDSNAQAEAAYAALAEGAQVTCPPKATSYSSFFTSLVDRFGVRWELIVEL